MYINLKLLDQGCFVSLNPGPNDEVYIILKHITVEVYIIQKLLKVLILAQFRVASLANFFSLNPEDNSVGLLYQLEILNSV